MSKDSDMFTKIGRIKPINDDKEYIITESFKKFFAKITSYFMVNSSDALYGINMSPYKTDAIVSFKIAGIYPFGEETSTSIKDIMKNCRDVSFTAKNGYMVAKFRYKDAFEIVLNDDDI